LYFSPEGSQVKSASSLVDTKWASWCVKLFSFLVLVFSLSFSFLFVCFFWTFWTDAQSFAHSDRTCPFGFPVNGVFDPSMDGTDINYVDRSPSEKLMVVVDDFGLVSLFRYPILEKVCVCVSTSSLPFLNKKNSFWRSCVLSFPEKSTQQRKGSLCSRYSRHFYQG
jgi:hypothetical protein